MDLQELFISIHNSLTTKEKRRKISSQDMADRIHCSKSTYDKYLGGKLHPKAVNNIMCLLSMLTDEALLTTVKQWREENEKKTINKKDSE